MSDGEFWSHVLDTGSLPEEELELVEQTNGERCPVCGEYDACMYDSEGRALIHADGLQSGE